MARKTNKGDLTFPKPSQKDIKPDIDFLNNIESNYFNLPKDEKCRLGKIKKLDDDLLEIDKIKK